jgi:biopolymer transport protein ExbD
MDARDAKINRANIFKQKIELNSRRKFVKNILLASVFMIFAFFGCQDSAKNLRVEFVDRDTVFAFNQKPNPLMLIVELTENGNLSLNKIETGTIKDPTLLAEKLKVIFDDREKAGISEREVVIDPQGNVKNEDLENLIESLAEAKASPIRVIKDNL